MRQIRRAAVTGLFAIWLAPLAAQGDARATDAGSDAALRGSGLTVEERQDRRDAARPDSRQLDSNGEA